MLKYVIIKISFYKNFKIVTTPTQTPIQPNLTTNEVGFDTKMTVFRRDAPRQHAPGRHAPGRHAPETICPGDDMPRRHYAPET